MGRKPVKKVLIVDDHPDIRKLVELVLSREGRVLLKADNGADAVRIARQEVPDLILMDMMMPGEFDGYQATRILKDDPVTCRCPIIAMTAKIQDDEIERTIASGADSFLGKPFLLSDLETQTEKFLSWIEPAGPGKSG